jgi:hypothetical protein
MLTYADTCWGIQEKNIMLLAKSPTTLIREGKTARDICEILSTG